MIFPFYPNNSIFDTTPVEKGERKNWTLTGVSETLSLHNVHNSLRSSELDGTDGWDDNTDGGFH